MSLQNEIRQVLLFHRGPLHPTIIRMQVLSNRSNGDKRQSLETFNRVMRSMPDIESIKIDGLWYRMFKADSNKTIAYHLRVILMIITVEGKRLWESLALEKRRRLMSKLEKIRLSIIRMLKRYER